MFNYEEEWFCPIKIDPVQEFPGSNLSHIFFNLFEYSRFLG